MNIILTELRRERDDLLVLLALNVKAVESQAAFEYLSLGWTKESIPQYKSMVIGYAERGRALIEERKKRNA